MALREFYAERYADAADEGVITVAAPMHAGHTPVSPLWQGAYQPRRRAVGVRPEDRWTLDYITILRIQPLLEAFDDDAAEAHVTSDHFRQAQQDLPQALVRTPRVISEKIGAEDWAELGEMSVD